MSSASITVQIPDDLSNFSLPPGLQKRLQFLLDKQDDGQDLTNDERLEAEGIVDMVDVLSLLRLGATRTPPTP